MDDGVDFSKLVRGAGAADIGDLRRNPAFVLLHSVVKRRLDAIAAEMFNGKPADPIRQGQGVAYRSLLKLLEQSPDDMLQQLRQETSP